MKKDDMNFEKSLARLDEVVAALEHGDVPLDQALALFEEGTKLVKSCSSMLDAAEQRVRILSSGKDGPVLDEFTATEEA